MFVSVRTSIQQGVHTICESIALLGQHRGILLLYFLFAKLALLALYAVAERGSILFVIGFLVIVFWTTCVLARHAMHLLRKQDAGMKESLLWAVHCTPVLLLWLVIFTFFLFGSIKCLLVITSWVGFSAWLCFAIFFAILFLFGLVTPILSTERVSLLHAFKRSVKVIGNNLIAYVSMLLVQTLILLALLIILIKISGLFHFFTRGQYIESILLLFICFFTVTNTVFYYTFYVKKEIELAEIAMTQQM